MKSARFAALFALAAFLARESVAGSDRFVPTANLIDARCFHTATMLRNGQVLVAGGLGDTGALTSAELYDQRQRSWSLTGNLITARFYYTAVLLRNGQVLVAGGYNTISQD